jgi:hypothetical protein
MTTKPTPLEGSVSIRRETHRPTVTPTNMGLLNTSVNPVVIAGTLFAFFITSRVYYYYRLSHIPGPWLAGWTRLWVRGPTLNGNQAREYAKLCQKYGRLVRIGPHELLTDDPDLIRQMNATRSAWKRSRWWDLARFIPRHDNILSVQDLRTHDELRKKMAAAYSGKENEMLEKSVDDRIAELINILDTRYLTQNAHDQDGNVRYVDMGRVAHWFTLDVITSLAYGSPLGDLTAEEDKFNYIEQSENSVYLILSMGFYPFIYNVLEYLRIADLMVYYSGGMGNIVRSMRPQLRKRFAQGLKQPKDMLGAFIRNGLSYKQIESETGVQL